MPVSPDTPDSPQDHRPDGDDTQPSDRLGLVRRGLYARDEPRDLQARQRALHRLGITRQPHGSGEHAGDTLSSTKYRDLVRLRAKRRVRLLRFSGLLGALLVIGITVSILFVWYRSRLTVTEVQIGISIEGPAELAAGDELMYQVHYGNLSRVDWHGVELAFTPPRGFTLLDSTPGLTPAGRQLLLPVGELASGARGEARIRGRLLGERNETALAEASVTITPDNFPSGQFVRTAVLATTISALPLELATLIPDDAASGERVRASLEVRNLSSQALSNVYVRLQPAPGMELLLTDPEMSTGFNAATGEWTLAELPALQTQLLTFIFVVSGQTGEQRPIGITAGIRQGEEDFVQRELTHIVTLSASEVVVQQRFQGESGPVVVRPGDHITGEVLYRNIGTVGLKDAIVKLKLEGIGYDPARLELRNGAYDPVTQTIFWSAATVPELAVVQPQESGVISYSFTLLPLAAFSDDPETGKNNVIVSTALLDSPDLPAPPGQPRQVISDRAILSVQTDPIFAVNAFYDDGRLGLKSSGPLPPRVAEQTTYTIRFRLGTTLNDVGDVRLIAVIPDGVSFTGQYYATKGEVTLTERAGRLEWTVPQIAGMTGRSRPPEELHVQVAVVPGDDLRGEVVSLVRELSATMTDLFVDRVLTVPQAGLPTTETAVPQKGVVK
ncbi:MAG: hypothetical protein COT71_01145 [Candidatus Andersenbacteria bacterium CG10_big_fil_rev_8_21_14_0_10_54_11]|uniref:DUF11 domain-containing protein n=1 Tax=Candidatus Andersenbacteria bacterium CG10_big_fil_rev_8_21_14_0_10_54_11 TaxID=1974485 RepID=A0A2M6X032_9BACT|nr:MAG: hypothetical protein COT71_01145 [Candidatus Andersenbacteria bacterium CG10_big_fil_rev_8_21_14_0_10_54_11]